MCMLIKKNPFFLTGWIERINSRYDHCSIADFPQMSTNFTDHLTPWTVPEKRLSDKRRKYVTNSSDAKLSPQRVSHEMKVVDAVALCQEYEKHLGEVLGDLWQAEKVDMKINGFYPLSIFIWGMTRLR